MHNDLYTVVFNRALNVLLLASKYHWAAVIGTVSKVGRPRGGEGGASTLQ
jgi:hypothetical protein